MTRSPGPRPSKTLTRQDDPLSLDFRRDTLSRHNMVQSQHDSPKSALPYSAIMHEQGQGILGHPPHYLRPTQAAAHVQHPGLERNDRSTRGSDCIVINTSVSEGRDDRESFSRQMGQGPVQLLVSQPPISPGFSSTADHNKQRMPFVRPHHQGAVTPLPLNGPPQFIIPQRAPTMQEFQLKPAAPSESPIKPGGEIRLPYQMPSSLFTHVLPSNVQGQSQFSVSPAPQMLNSLTQLKSLDPLSTGQPQIQIPSFVRQNHFTAASQPLPIANFGSDQQQKSSELNMMPEKNPNLEPLQPITEEKIVHVSSLTASLSQIFGNGQQLPQLYAALNPQQGPVPSPRPPTQQKPLATNVSDNEKKDNPSCTSPGLPLSPNEKNSPPPLPVTESTVEAGPEKVEKVKEMKGLKAFKCTLVEFVKEVLRPTWKEGQMSKESHKTIVKKTVEKVISTLEGNIPHNKERIDLYMSYSKDKLTKLVQVRSSPLTL